MPLALPAAAPARGGTIPGRVPNLRGSSCGGTSYFAIQPRPRQRPVALDRDWRDAQRRGRLLHGEAAEKAQLDQPALALVDPGELLECDVEGQDVDSGSLHPGVDVQQREGRTSASLRRCA